MNPTKLKIWNGRGPKCRGEHFFVAAKNRTDAAKLVAKAANIFCGCPEREIDARDIGQYTREIRDYYSEGCWGIKMEGITPERGVWLTVGHNDTPKRLI